VIFDGLTPRFALHNSLGREQWFIFTMWRFNLGLIRRAFVKFEKKKGP
jgi:hypothetical protein